MQICWRLFNPILMQMMRRGLILRAKAQLVPSARHGEITAARFQTKRRKRGKFKKTGEAGAAAGVRVGRHLQGSAGQRPARLQHEATRHTPEVTHPDLSVHRSSRAC